MDDHQEKRFLAHLSENGEREQTVLEHLSGTAGLAAGFAEPFCDIISVTERMAYGKSSRLGSIGAKARSAR